MYLLVHAYSRHVMMMIDDDGVCELLCNAELPSMPAGGKKTCARCWHGCELE